MLSKTYRFHGRAGLGAVYSKGKTVRHGNIALRYFKNERRHNYRLAVVVSKKTEKSAVKRNRIRRRIYEVAKSCLAETTSPYDLVITVYNSNVAEIPHPELKNDLTNLLNKAAIL